MAKHREGEITVFLGADSALEGLLNFKGQARLDGRFQGRIEGQGTLFIGPQAQVEAEVNSTRVVISGNLVGNVQASERIELKAPGKLKGNISSPLVVMDEGVLFEGHCSMTGEAGPASTGNKITLLASKL
ncbi:MAG: polymer-forming cytoskeletal protein [Desulfarculus sp.]|nr:polymer-forming cytoskeletal protein [Desulfarculus sp.]